MQRDFMCGNMQHAGKLFDKSDYLIIVDILL
jgi:hypothetical protein